MTAPAAETGIGTWRVEIPLPIGADWLSLNKPSRGKWDDIRRHNLTKNLRRLTFEALRDAGVPQRLGRIRVQAELRFTLRRHRDTGNFEPTLKPMIDALQPTRTKTRVTKKKIGNRTVPVEETVTEWGWGVVEGDDPRYLERPELIFGEPIGSGTGRKGIVIFHITALTAGPIDNLEDQCPPPATTKSF